MTSTTLCWISLHLFFSLSLKSCISLSIVQAPFIYQNIAGEFLNFHDLKYMDLDARN